MNAVAQRIREVRKENKLTQAQFADLLSVSQDTVSLRETGKSIPTTDLVMGICKAFKISADYLLGLSEF